MKHLITLALALLSSSAQAVKLEYQAADGTWQPGLKVNGQVFTEGATAAVIQGASVDAGGNYVLTLTGRLTYESADKPAAYGAPASYDPPIDASVFTQYGGVPGLFVLGAQACTFPYLKPYSGWLDPKWGTTIIVSEDQTSRCLPMFSFSGQAHQIRDPGNGLTLVTTYYDQNYGVVMNHVPAADGTFTKTITVPTAQASAGFSLTYQLPDVKYGAGNVTTQVKKSFSVAAVRSDTYTATDNGTALTARTVSATITPDAADLGKTGSIYVAVVIGKDLYFKTPTGWVLYTSGALPAYKTGVALASTTVDLTDGKPLDLSGIKGATVYVGYGVGSGTLADTDLTAKSKYKMVYTIR